MQRIDGGLSKYMLLALLLPLLAAIGSVTSSSSMDAEVVELPPPPALQQQQQLPTSERQLQPSQRDDAFLLLLGGDQQKRAGASRSSSGRVRSGSGGPQSQLYWGSVATSAAEREPSCAELRAMWRHTRRIIRHAATPVTGDPASDRRPVAAHQLPSFVNTVEYAFAPKFLRFWHAQPRRGAAAAAAAATATGATSSAALPVGRVLLTKTKSKRPPPNSLSLTSNTEYQVLSGRSSGDKVARAPGGLAAAATTSGLGALAGGVGYFHEDDEGGELVFQDPSGSLDGLPREDEVFGGAYGTIVRSPEEKAKLRREFLLSGAAAAAAAAGLNNNRLAPSAQSAPAAISNAKDVDTLYVNKDNGYNNNFYNPYYRYKSKFEICREKVENAPCRSDADCFCSKSVHPYTCHDALGVCTRKGGMQVLRDTYGRWFQRPFDTRELGFNQRDDEAAHSDSNDL